MKPSAFPLSSDQLQLLQAFANAESLLELSEKLHRDTSVISRNLQRIAEALPVLVKQKGRWQITPLGQQINSCTMNYLDELQKLTGTQGKRAKASGYLDNSALLIVNAQMGLRDPSLGSRNNSDAENNISKLLSRWRKTKKPIFHVKHVSINPASSFYSKSGGVDFIPLLAPMGDENVIEKSKSGAFSETSLNDVLEKLKIENLVLTGFTANECIDATARQACDLGFSNFVVGDATAMFDFSGPEGRLYKAEKMHRLTLANLHALFAKVIDTSVLLKDIESAGFA